MIAKKKILIIAAVAIVAIVGAVFVVMQQLKSARISTVAGLQNAIAPAATPHVSFVLIKTKNGNQIAVNWSDLPAGTQMLDIYLQLASAKTVNGSSTAPTLTLWKTIAIPSGQLTSGTQSFNIGTSTFAGDSFYAEAIGTGPGESESGTTPGENASGTPGGPGTILWISSSTLPTESTSTTPSGYTPPPAQPTPTSTMPTPPTTPTSTNGNPTSTPTTPPDQNPTSTNGNGNNPPPTGIPYYNPQHQLEGYAPYQTGDFWLKR